MGRYDGKMARLQRMRAPAVTAMLCPVIADASSEARNSDTLLRLHGAAERARRDQRLANRLGRSSRPTRHARDPAVDQLAGDESDHETVHPDPERTHFVGEGLRQRDETELGHGVVGLLRAHVHAGRRGAELDVPAAGGDHRLAQHLAGEEHGAGQVRGQRVAPVLERHLRDGHVHPRGAGIVHQHVEPPEAIERVADQPRAVVLAADVGRYRMTRPARGLDLRGRFLERAGPASGDHDPCACLRVGGGQHAADAAASTGDEDPAVDQAAGHGVTRRVPCAAG
jgi:hypothetical protein